jgi:hypothetical protein
MATPQLAKGGRGAAIIVRNGGMRMFKISMSKSRMRYAVRWESLRSAMAR